MGLEYIGSGKPDRKETVTLFGHENIQVIFKVVNLVVNRGCLKRIRVAR